jgi:hypothetical protein
MPLDQADLDKITALIKGSITAEALSPLIGEALKPSLTKLEQDNAKLRAELEAVKAKPEGEKKPRVRRSPRAALRAPTRPPPPSSPPCASASMPLRRPGPMRPPPARSTLCTSRSARPCRRRACPPTAWGWPWPSSRNRGSSTPRRAAGRARTASAWTPCSASTRGAASWLKSDTGKLFLPPSPAQGTGGGPGFGAGPAGGDGTAKLSDLAGRGLSGALSALSAAG